MLHLIEPYLNQVEKAGEIYAVPLNKNAAMITINIDLDSDELDLALQALAKIISSFNIDVDFDEAPEDFSQCLLNQGPPRRMGMMAKLMNMSHNPITEMLNNSMFSPPDTEMYEGPTIYRIRQLPNGVAIQRIKVMSNNPEAIRNIVQNFVMNKVSALYELASINPIFMQKYADVFQLRNVTRPPLAFVSTANISNKQAEFNEETVESFTKTANQITKEPEFLTKDAGWEDFIKVAHLYIEKSSAANRALLQFVDVDTLEKELYKRAEITQDNSLVTLIPKIKDGSLFEEITPAQLVETLKEYDRINRKLYPSEYNKIASPIESIFGEIKADLSKRFDEISDIIIDGVKVTKEKLKKVLQVGIEKLSRLWKSLLNIPSTKELLIEAFPKSFLSAPSSFKKEVAKLIKEYGLADED